MARWFLLIIVLLVTPVAATSDSTGPVNAAAFVPVVPVKGAIGPATADFLLRIIKQTDDNPQAPMLVITLDTPGGLVSSLRMINSAILAAKKPIVCLVYPQGARAASAGTYLLYACHIAAMAPATTLGAATPVSIGGSPGQSPDDDQTKREPSAIEKKMLNDSIAYIRSLAQLRGRNAEWAELAVKEAATLTANEALAKNVINLIADDPQALMAQLNGQTIKVANTEQKLQLDGITLREQKADWRSSFISTITNPNIAYILMMLGFYGLLFEFYNPGLGISGVVGAIALLIALYAFQLLPVNWTGMLLLILGIALLVTESMMPSFGIFGFGGLVAFVIGSIFLLDSDLKQFQIAIPVIAAFALTSGGFFAFLLGYLWRARNQKVVSGIEAMLGGEATVVDDFQGKGQILFEGEQWTAYCEKPVKRHQTVIITAVDGLVLTVTANQEH